MEIDYTPHESQQKIHEALRPYNQSHLVMVIAGRRFGKTLLACAEMATRALSKPGSRIWYVAPTKEQAYMIAWRLLLKPRIDKEGVIHEPILPPEEVSKIREDRHYIELNNGSLIEFMGVTTEVRLLGAGLDFCVFDEFVNLPYSVWYDTIKPMLVYSKGDVLFIGTIPDPKVHNITIEYLDMFEECESGAITHGKSFTFASINNPYLEESVIEEHIKDLEKRGRGEDARRLYSGDYTREHGLVFPVFSYDLHTVEPFEVPLKWKRVMAVDPHPQKPIFALWAAVDPKGQHWIYREKEFRDEDSRPFTVQETAYEILVLETNTKEKVWQRFIDPTYAKVQHDIIGQKSVKDLFRDYGLGFQEADRTFITFFNGFSDKMVEEPEPSIKIFRSCPGLIRQLNHYVWDSWASSRAREEKGVKDKPKKTDDDFVDCLKYIINANVTPQTFTTKMMQSFKSRLESRWKAEQRQLT